MHVTQSIHKQGTTGSIIEGWCRAVDVSKTAIGSRTEYGRRRQGCDPVFQELSVTTRPSRNTANKYSYSHSFLPKLEKNNKALYPHRPPLDLSRRNTHAMKGRGTKKYLALHSGRVHVRKKAYSIIPHQSSIDQAERLCRVFTLHVGSCYPDANINIRDF